MASDYLTAIKLSLGRITRAQNEVELYNSIAESLIDHFGFARATLRNVNSDGKTLSLICDLGFINENGFSVLPISNESRSSDNVSEGCMVLYEEEEVLTADRLLPEFAGLSVVMVSSPYALIPIKVKGRVAVVLGVAKKRDSGIITPKDKEVLELLAEVGGSASENIMSNEVLIRDELTEIYNRHYFMKRLNEEFERATRYSVPLSCCLFDIDDFKLINDTHGHIFGDKVLKQIAGLTRDIVRGTDIVARYGGDEFVILFTHTRQEDAVIAVEQISRTISRLILCEDEKEARVTATFGLARFQQINTKDPGTLLHHADMALYEGKKQHQKNSIVIYTEEGFRVLKREDSLIGKIRDIKKTFDRSVEEPLLGGTAKLKNAKKNLTEVNAKLAGIDNPSQISFKAKFLTRKLSQRRNLYLFTSSGLAVILFLLMFSFSGKKEAVGNSSVSNGLTPKLHFMQSQSDSRYTLSPVSIGGMAEIVHETLFFAGRAETKVVEGIEKGGQGKKISLRKKKAKPILAMAYKHKVKKDARTKLQAKTYTKMNLIEDDLKRAFLLPEL